MTATPVQRLSASVKFMHVDAVVVILEPLRDRCAPCRRLVVRQSCCGATKAERKTQRFTQNSPETAAERNVNDEIDG